MSFSILFALGMQAPKNLKILFKNMIIHSAEQAENKA